MELKDAPNKVIQNNIPCMSKLEDILSELEQNPTLITQIIEFQRNCEQEPLIIKFNESLLLDFKAQIIIIKIVGVSNRVKIVFFESYKNYPDLKYVIIDAANLKTNFL
jgi:hypothetical protein